MPGCLLLGWLTLVLCLSLTESGARAEGSNSTATPEVRALVQKSSTDFAAGNYAEALSSLLAAYDAQPLPLLLFNIAQTYRKLGQPSSALDYYQRFVRAAPSSTLVPEAEAHAAALRAELAAESAARQRADAEELARQAQERLKEAEALAAANVAARRQAEAELLAGRQSAVRTPIYKRPWLYVGIGAVAVVGLGLGLGFGLGLAPPPEPSGDLPAQTLRF